MTGDQSLRQIALSIAQATKIRGKGTVIAGTDSLLAVTPPNLRSATKTAPYCLPLLEGSLENEKRLSDCFRNIRKHN
jgi:hypothetical protein